MSILSGKLPESRLARTIAVPVLTLLITAASVVMIGPQILVIVPVALGIGINLAFRRSFGALICFGYLFTAGLLSALIGYLESDGGDYVQTLPFAISLGVGLVGVSLISIGLWKTLLREKVAT